MPWPVFIGMFLQYTIMPLVGFGIATLLRFEPEIGAGIVLIGSAPEAPQVSLNLKQYRIFVSFSLDAVNYLGVKLRYSAPWRGELLAR